MRCHPAIKRLGIAFVARKDAFDLSGGLLKIRYRLDRPLDAVVVTFKPAGQAASPQLISKEVLADFAATGRGEQEPRSFCRQRRG